MSNFNKRARAAAEAYAQFSSIRDNRVAFERGYHAALRDELVREMAEAMSAVVQDFVRAKQETESLGLRIVKLDQSKLASLYDKLTAYERALEGKE